MAIRRATPTRIEAEDVLKFQHGDHYVDPDKRLGPDFDPTVPAPATQSVKPPQEAPVARSRPLPWASAEAAIAVEQAAAKARAALVPVQFDPPLKPVEPKPIQIQPLKLASPPTQVEPIKLVKELVQPLAELEVSWEQTVSIGGVKVRYTDVTSGEFPGRRYVLTDILKQLDNSSAVRWAAPGEEPTTVWVTAVDSAKRNRAQAVTMKVLVKVVYGSRGFNAGQLQERLAEQFSDFLIRG